MLQSSPSFHLKWDKRTESWITINTATFMLSAYNEAALKTDCNVYGAYPTSDVASNVPRKHWRAREKFIVRQQHPKDKQTNRDIRNFIIHSLYEKLPDRAERRNRQPVRNSPPNYAAGN